MPARMLTRLDLCDAPEMYEFGKSVGQSPTAKVRK
jgi:hypothetical protein